MIKTSCVLLVAIALAWGVAAHAAEAPESNPATPKPATAVATPNGATAAEPAPAAGTNGLRMDFRGAPLNLVLDYLSEAAGFIINKETDVRGTVDVWSKHPLTKEEAVELLNSVLKKNGYAVTRNGRILTIVSMDNAKTSDLEIVTGNNPEDVDKSDEVVTQIIPVRHANASQLLNNLNVLLPTSATLTVNESANSLILVATKTDIRRMLRIISALDTSIASVSSIRVFPLQFADARQLATVVQQLFAQPAAATNPRAQIFAMMRGGGGFPGGPGGPGGGGMPGGGAGGNAAGSRVVAAADEYSNSLIVSAAPDLMATIADMVIQVDQPISDVTELRVFRLMNADPTELAEQFTQLFPDDTRSGSSGNSQRFRFAGPGGRFGGGMNAATGTNDRMRKKTRVIAVPDQRTSSLIVTAAAEMMPQIAEMIEQLDSNAAKQEKVAVYELQNADPSDVYQVLQDLFNRNTTMRNSSANNRNSMLGQNNPLNQRATQQQRNNSAASSRVGGTTRRTGTGF